MTVRSCHLPRKAESNRKSAAAPSGADVEHFSVYVIKKIWSLRQCSDNKFHCRVKSAKVNQHHAKFTRYKLQTYFTHNRLSVEVFGNFIRMLYLLTIFLDLWSKLSLNPVYGAQHRLVAEQTQLRKYSLYHF